MSMMTLGAEARRDGGDGNHMTDAASSRGRTQVRRLRLPRPLRAADLPVVLMAVFAIIEPRFLSPLNLFNIMRQVSIFGLLAIGMTFVILTAGIDLSVGSLLAFAGLVAAAVPRAASPTASPSARARTR